MILAVVLDGEGRPVCSEIEPREHVFSLRLGLTVGRFSEPVCLSIAADEPWRQRSRCFHRSKTARSQLIRGPERWRAWSQE
jgi:hypothetical protein